MNLGRQAKAPARLQSEGNRRAQKTGREERHDGTDKSCAEMQQKVSPDSELSAADDGAVGSGEWTPLFMPVDSSLHSCLDASSEVPDGPLVRRCASTPVDGSNPAHPHFAPSTPDRSTSEQPTTWGWWAQLTTSETSVMVPPPQELLATFVAILPRPVAMLRISITRTRASLLPRRYMGRAQQPP